MSAPEDNLIIADMEEHAEEYAACETAGCYSGATTLIVMRCCPARWQSCDKHFNEMKDSAIAFLGICERTSIGAHCHACRHINPPGASFDDVYRVVTL